MRTLLFLFSSFRAPPTWLLCLDSCIVLERFWFCRYYYENLVISLLFLPQPPPLILVSCFLHCSWEIVTRFFRYYHEIFPLLFSSSQPRPLTLASCFLHCSWEILTRFFRYYHEKLVISLFFLPPLPLILVSSFLHCSLEILTRFFRYYHKNLVISLLFLPPPLNSCVLFLSLFLRDSGKIL